MFSVKGALFKLLGGHGEVYHLLALTYGLSLGYLCSYGHGFWFHAPDNCWLANIFSGSEILMGNIVMSYRLLLAGTRL